MFQAQVDLLQSLLVRREDSVGHIDQLLNSQKEPVEYQQNFPLLLQRFYACCVTREQAELLTELDRAHWNAGFTPRDEPGNALFDPVEQMLRAFHLWRQTRWPGAKGRARFAHTLFNLQVLRQLTLLCLRLWDEDTHGAGARLAQLQTLLDDLWRGSPPDQPRLVRDVRWLFPLAMSPTTDSLAGYFPVAQHIADDLPDADSRAIFQAWVLTGAGHLRSQLYQMARQRNVSLDDRALVLITRMSNALDVALLVQGLVPLLTAYARSVAANDAAQRRELAQAIHQGISPDPELFVNRLDLLAPYSMIELLFVTPEHGRTEYTNAGRRHLALLAKYTELMRRLAPALHADYRRGNSAYLPYGALYGFSSNLVELMAFKTLQLDAPIGFSLEDIFTEGDAAKLAWVNGWRNLPHIKPEVVKQFEYPRQFAEAGAARVEQALQTASAGTAATRSGRLFLGNAVEVADLPLTYIVSSDPQLVAGGKATFKDPDDLLHCRFEGEFLVSYRTDGGWLALTKDLLTDVLGAGRDAKLAILPPQAAGVLRAMCPGLIAP